MYDDVIICKPLTSRPSNSERYIVCKNFKLNEKDKKPILEKLEKLMEKIKNTYNKNNYIIDIFSDYNIPEDLHKQIVNSNIILSNKQYKEINKIIEYKNSGNYFGEKYHKYKNEQIKANKWWIDTYYPKKITDIKNTLKKLNQS